jgi:hypothetical protein
MNLKGVCCEEERSLEVTGVAFLLAVWSFFHSLRCIIPAGIVRTNCTVTVIKGMSVMLVIAWLQMETINCVLTPAVGVTSHRYGMAILTQVINDSVDV